VVTAGLVLAGALLGAVAGGGALAGGLVLTGEWGELAWGFVRAAAALGAAAGAVLGPLCAWVLLRRVPLALALSVPTLGTLAGGTAAWCAGAFPPLGALAGFGVAALGLRVLVDRAGGRVDPRAGSRVPGPTPRPRTG
jgi:hypothetical protein